MDGRKKNKEGEDGAVQLNAQELRKFAAKHRKPIAAIRAFHTKPADAPHMQPEKISEDDFNGGLLSVLEVCEGARVLLTMNLWVEAGLMNGAMGYVRGFIWPPGGDPGSTDSKLRAPFCILVEFDDIDMGCDGRGMRRSFFPDHPDRAKWVPIFPTTQTAACELDSVSRAQFPLVLAWALTHWRRRA